MFGLYDAKLRDFLGIRTISTPNKMQRRGIPSKEITPPCVCCP